MASSDFNGDGVLDLIAANHDTHDVSVLLGNGDGTFAAALSFSRPSPFSVTIGDFDGDGTFGIDQSFVVGEEPTSVVSGDFDGDGELDLATANSESDDVSVLLGNGDGAFAAQASEQESVDTIVHSREVRNHPGDDAVLERGSQSPRERRCAGERFAITQGTTLCWREVRNHPGNDAVLERGSQSPGGKTVCWR